jgi:hypothetical protein
VGVTGGGGGGVGISLSGVGTFINAGHITGGAGGSGAGFQTYYTTNGGSGGAGAVFAGATVLTNRGTIGGGQGGAAGRAPRGAGYAGPGGKGVVFSGAGGTLINGSPSARTALVTGVIGVYGASGSTGTVINYGTIKGTGGTAVQFHSASDRLVVEAGGIFQGSVQGGGGVLELGGAAGTITGLGSAPTVAGVSTTFSGFGTYAFDTAGWVIAGTETVTAGHTINGAGAPVVSGTLTNFGAIGGTSGVAVKLSSASDRLIAEAGSTWTGTVEGDGGTLELAAVGAESITGLGGAGSLTGAVSASVSGFGAYVIDSGVNVTLTGSSTIAQGDSLTVDGSIAFGGNPSTPGVLAVGGYLDLAGSIAGPPGPNPQGAGGVGVQLLAGGTVTLGGAINGGGGLSGGGQNYQGGAGGGAISGSSSGTITNNAGVIAGGAGGGGHYYFGPGAGGAGGSGVALESGLVTNNSGTIAGGSGGGGVSGYDQGGAGGAGGAGVSLASGGTVTNAGGTIAGGAGGAGGAAGYVGGSGGAGGAGVVLGGGGEVINSGGTISGAGGGGGGSGGNSSGGSGQGGYGVVLSAGGLVVNGTSGSNSALIEGQIGVYAGSGGAATVTNYGVIDGAGGVAVRLAAGKDRLIDEAGSTFNGAVSASGGTLELAAGTATITGLGTSFSGFGSYQVDAGGTWTLTGTNTVAGALTGAGTLIVGSGATKLAKSGNLSGGVTVKAGTLELAAAGAGGTGPITFAGPATVQIDAAALPASGGTFADTLAHFGTGDSLDLKSLAYVRGATATVASGVLTVKSGSQTTLFKLTTPSSNYYAYGDGSGGVLVTTTALAAATWKTAVNADFGTAADWTAGAVPNGLLTSATIAVAGTYTVTVAAGKTFLEQGLTLNNVNATLNLAGTLNLVGPGLTVTAGTVQLLGGSVLTGGASVAAAGVVRGHGSLAGPVANAGTVYATEQTLLFTGPVTGSGAYVIFAGATLAFGGAAAAKTITFRSGGTEILKLSGVLASTTTLAGFAAGAVIDMVGQKVTADRFASGVLTLYNGAAVVDAFSVAGTFTAQVFALASDGSGGTKITLASDAKPSITVPGGKSVKAGVALAITGVSIADADAVAASQTITVTITDKTGLLSATAATGSKVTGSGSKTLVISGALGLVNTDLATLVYKSATATSDTITLAANDGDGGVAANATIAVGVTAATVPVATPLVFSQAMAGFGDTGGALALATVAPPAASAPLASLLARGA